MAREPQLTLRVDEGPSSGAELPLVPGTFVIGRDGKADLVLVGDETVSKRHAEVVATESGVTIRNHSPNGTLVNDRPILESALVAGDTVAVGVIHLLRVQRYVRPAPPPRKPVAPVDGTPGGAKPVGTKSTPPAIGTTRGFRLPPWLVAYFVLMALAFVFFGVRQALYGDAPTLSETLASERRYASAARLQSTETDRVVKLLEAAAVRERRGDIRSAYEVYREVMAARHPIIPQSPAYRYAASRMAELGPK